eukprot:Hpha_TRINITY_DN25244_c0_g1::TRINITY_DN25244_c0_g1_i1::g.110777::m.110777/K13989/DERL2_3; Derlin-2/3
MDIGLWWSGLPPVTKFYLRVLFFLTALPFFGVGPQWFALTPGDMAKGQLWRPLTAAIYHGPVDIGLLFHVLILANSSSEVERLVFGGIIVKYLWFLVVQSFILSGFALVLGWGFTSHCLAPMLLFVRCRSNPNQEMGFYFDIRCKALYFPLVWSAFHFLLGVALLPDFVGYVVGHLFVYHTQLAHPNGTLLPCHNWWELPDPVRRLLEHATRKYH